MLRSIPLLCVAALLTTPAAAGEIVHTGMLSGGGGATTQDFTVPQFDDQGGTLVLTQVTFDALTATSGGFTTDGSGIAVDIFSSLTVDYFLGTELLVETQAVIDQTVQNPAGGPIFAALVFDTDEGQAIVSDPAELQPWVGSGDVTLTAFSELIVTESPPGVIFFGAGGSVSYTVTYEFEDAPVGTPFVRGDVNLDGAVDISDAISALGILFVPGTPPAACADAADANDDGASDLSDAIYLLSQLFSAGDPPAAPFPDCGLDPTMDGLECATYPCP